MQVIPVDGSAVSWASYQRECLNLTDITICVWSSSVSESPSCLLEWLLSSLTSLGIRTNPLPDRIWIQSSLPLKNKIRNMWTLANAHLRENNTAFSYIFFYVALGWTQGLSIIKQGFPHWTTPSTPQLMLLCRVFYVSYFINFKKNINNTFVKNEFLSMGNKDWWYQCITYDAVLHTNMHIHRITSMPWARLSKLDLKFIKCQRSSL